MPCNTISLLLSRTARDVILRYHFDTARWYLRTHGTKAINAISVLDAIFGAADYLYLGYWGCNAHVRPRTDIKSSSHHTYSGPHVRLQIRWTFYCLSLIVKIECGSMFYFICRDRWSQYLCCLRAMTLEMVRWTTYVKVNFKVSDTSRHFMMVLFRYKCMFLDVG